jgi:hypothetical protein
LNIQAAVTSDQKHMTNPRHKAQQLKVGNGQPGNRTGLVRVDDNIDEIARKALERARRAEEAERLRRKISQAIPPKGDA